MEKAYSSYSSEPTKQELPPKPQFRFTFDRRKFFQLFGGGLAVAFVLQDVFSFAGEANTNDTNTADTGKANAWIHIGADGMVSVFTGKVEVGQNIRTSLSQVVAEELHTPIASIKMIMGDTDLVPFDSGTYGSLTTPRMGLQLRKAAATIREELIKLAAKAWSTEAANLQAKEGAIIDTASDKKISYGELTKGEQLLLPISDSVKLTPASDWSIAGKTAKKINGPSFITGKHQYVSDMKLPGMLYGKILRPPSYNVKLINVDVNEVKKLSGVMVVQDGDFIGVAAPTPELARKAINSIQAKWEEVKDQPSTATVFDYLVQKSEKASDRNADHTGDVEQKLKEADYRHSKKYNINYIAHVPLEPRAAVAEWKDEKLTVWTGTQRPFGVQENLAEIFRMPKEKVRVIMPDTGSGYGGKHTGEAGIEAARLAQEVKRPVKIVWTREEEFNWAYFRPGGVIEVKAGVKKDGTITGWKFINYNLGPSGLSTQYKIATKQIAHIPSDSPLKQGSYRGLASTANVFAREAHITDLARLVKMDQLEFRLKNSDDARLTAVLEAAAKAFGWNSKKPIGHGYGIGCGFEKGGYVATCAEVSLNHEKEVKLLRVVQAFECGAIVNPLHLENQIMGSIVQGLGGALFEAVDFAEGKIRNGKLSSYRVPRFSDMPKIEIVMIDRKDLPSAGAGEAAIIGIAPAVRNAILDAGGPALTELPLVPKAVV